jgi:hypothetical protein
VDTDDAARASGGPEPRPDCGPGSGPAIRPDADVVDEALEAMTKAVASLRDQAARMINTVPIKTSPIKTAPEKTAPPVLPAQDPPGDA